MTLLFGFHIAVFYACSSLFVDQAQFIKMLNLELFVMSGLSTSENVVSIKVLNLVYRLSLATCEFAWSATCLKGALERGQHDQ